MIAKSTLLFAATLVSILLHRRSDAFVSLPKHDASISTSSLYAGYSASDLLYQDQQEARARRASVEEDLLNKSTIKPLVAPKLKVPPIKSGSGFGGGGGAKKNGKKNKAADVESTPAQRVTVEQAKIIHKDGVLRIDNALDAATCDVLKRYVLRQQEIADEATAANLAASTEYYGVENRRKKRCDLLLSLVPPEEGGYDELDRDIIPKVLQKLLGKGGTLTPIYEELVTPEGEFYEFAAVITDPGSDRQQIHPDLPFRKEAPLYVIFLALQDVTEEMGPTTFLLGSQSYAERVKFEDHAQRDEQLSSADCRLSLLNKGDAVLFDARVLHCGNANDEEKGSTRAMFNFSFRNPKEIGNLGYCGSMRPGYVGALTLGVIGELLADYDGEKGNNENPFARYGNGLLSA